jgi:hypothetical protein
VRMFVMGKGAHRREGEQNDEMMRGQCNSGCGAKPRKEARRARRRAATRGDERRRALLHARAGLDAQGERRAERRRHRIRNAARDGTGLYDHHHRWCRSVERRRGMRRGRRRCRVIGARCSALHHGIAARSPAEVALVACVRRTARVGRDFCAAQSGHRWQSGTADDQRSSESGAETEHVRILTRCRELFK